MLGFICAILILVGSSNSPYSIFCPRKPDPAQSDSDSSADVYDESDSSLALDVDVNRDCTPTNWFQRQDEIQEFNRLVDNVQTNFIGREFLQALNPLTFPERQPLKKFNQQIFGYDFELELTLVHLEVLGIGEVTILPTNVTGNSSLALGFFFPKESFEIQAQVELRMTQRTTTGCVEAPPSVIEALPMGQPIAAPERANLMQRKSNATTCVQACFLSWFPGSERSESKSMSDSSFLDSSSDDTFYTASEEHLEPKCPERRLPLNITFGLHDLLLTSDLTLDMMECTPEARTKFGPKVCRSTSLEQLTRAARAGPEALATFIKKVLGKISEMSLTKLDAEYTHVDVSQVKFADKGKRFLNVFLRFVSNVVQKGINRIKPLHRALQRALVHAGLDSTNKFIDFAFREQFGGSCVHS